MLEDIRKRIEFHKSIEGTDKDWVQGEVYVEDTEFMLSLIDKYKRILQFYADADAYEQYGMGIAIMEDKGKLARDILEKE